MALKNVVIRKQLPLPEYGLALLSQNLPRQLAAYVSFEPVRQ